VRLLAAEYVDPDALARSVEAVRGPIEESYAALDSAEAIARELPHRERVLMINHRFARRILDAHAAWLEEAEAELRGARARRR
jgi:hypothetical protein